MAVNRELLQQELQRARSVSDAATSGQGFDPRGGYGVLATQLATAGVGAYAQNKAKKALLEEDQANQQAFAQQFPQYATLAPNLSREARDAITIKSIGANIEAQNKAPSFTIRDTKQGVVRINPATGEAFPISIGGEVALPTQKGTNIDLGKQETSFEKETGKKKAEQLNQIIESGDNAFKFDTNLDEIEKALNEGAFVGPGATKVAAVNEISAALGLPADLDKAANTRVIEQRIGDLTLQATGKLKGAISEKELDLAKKTVADIGTSEVANRKAIAVLRRLNSYDQGLSDIASGLEQEGKFTTDFRKARKSYNKQFREELRDLIKQTPQEQVKQEGQPPESGFKIISVE